MKSLLIPANAESRRNCPSCESWRTVVPYCLAVSNLKCDTRPVDFLVKDFLRGLEAQAGAGSCVEAKGDLVEVLLRVDAQVDAFGQLLADQAVHVFVGRPLPRAARFAEIDYEFQSDDEFGVAGHFLALVVSEAGAREGGDAVEAALEAGQGGVRVAVPHLRQDREAALALDERADGAG